jgi:hypothetical protein
MIQNKPYNPFTRLFSVTIVTCNLNSATLQWIWMMFPHSFPQSYSAIVLEVVVRIKSQFW